MWFAWKLVLLQYRKQRKLWRCRVHRSCDLLENSYFCSIANNRDTQSLHIKMLWFAWKLVLLQYRKQPWRAHQRYRSSCDLLENSYFCSIANNLKSMSLFPMTVVICLKTRTFAVSQTTPRIGSLHVGSCDLLENSYFCSIANNAVLPCPPYEVVVICLKTRTFAVSQTTLIGRVGLREKLWFAWKLVLLQYRKQLTSLSIANVSRCDLLENSYFCSIANNTASPTFGVTVVVICLKTRTFAVSQTTRNPVRCLPLSCDLLENSYFCSIANNRLSIRQTLNDVVICLKTRTFAVSQTTI